MAQTIDVNITPNNFMPMLYYSQGDIGREFKINIVSADGYTIPSGATAVIQATKPSGFGFTVQGTIANSAVTFVTTTVMTDEYGRFPAELKISSGDTVIYSANFLMIGEKNTHPEGTIDGSQGTIVPELTLLVERIEAAAEHVDEQVEKVTGMTASATTLPAGSEATASYDSETSTLNLGIPRGADGEVQYEQLLDSFTVGKPTDTVPYKFRQTGGGKTVGGLEKDKIVGGSLVWNQKVNNGNFTTNGNWAGRYASVSVSNNTAVVTVTSSGTERGLFDNSSSYEKAIKGHKYLLMIDVLSPVNGTCGLSISGGGGYSTRSIPVVANTWTHCSCIWTLPTSVTSEWGLKLYALISSPQANSVIQYKNAEVIDLTQMFGSTIADYIYSLEQNTAGAGVAWFKNLFPNDYYAYNAGELISVQGLTSHDTVGFNQWDEETEQGAINLITGQPEANTSVYRSKNFISIFPSTTYCYTNKNSSSGVRLAFYDENKNYITYISNNNPVPQTFVTPPNARYMKFYAGDSSAICINLSSNRNGDYEPYVKHVYPLDSSLTLRGIPKLANNEMYYDGDEYAYDGTVTRKYASVDLGTLDWTYSTPDEYRPNGMMYANVGATKKGGSNIICAKYPTREDQYGDYDKFIAGEIANTYVYVIDTSMGTDAASFKSAMSGVYLVYELATPTTETAEPYEEVQVCSKYGTEEYVSTSLVPVGHSTEYPLAIQDTVPTANGTYVLKATVSASGASFSWVSE